MAFSVYFFRCDNSQLFDEFLQVLGDKVRLRGFDKYKGGLDTVHDLTGEFSGKLLRYFTHTLALYLSISTLFDSIQVAT